MKHWLTILLAATAAGAMAAPLAPAGPPDAAASQGPDAHSASGPVAMTSGTSGSSETAALRQQAQQAIREGRFKDAVLALQNVADKMPNDPGVTADLGWALLEDEKTSDARRQFQRALRLDPMNLRAQDGLVTLAIRDRHPDEAVRIASDTVKARPTSGMAFRILGDAQRAAARRAEAEDAYRRAVTLDPNDARAHAGLADVLFVRGRTDESVKEYRAAVQLDPTKGAYQEGLGRAALLGGRYAEAALAFATSMDLARQPRPDWPRLDSLALLALDALGRASQGVHGGSESREDMYQANSRLQAVTDALASLPVVQNADPTTDPAMAQRSLAYGLIGQATASDLASLKNDTMSEAADAFVFREQARRALMAARVAAATPPSSATSSAPSAPPASSSAPATHPPSDSPAPSAAPAANTSPTSKP